MLILSKLPKFSIALLSIVLIEGTAKAATVNIDFSLYATGTPLTFLSGVTFSLQGGPDFSGAPTTARGGLSNSSNAGNYPTATILLFSFDDPANDISFSFNNEGLGVSGGRGDSFFQAYDSSGALLETGNLSGLAGSSVSLLTDGVKTLEFNNRTNGGDSWVFEVNSLTATMIPEPTSAALLGLASFGLVFRRRRLLRNCF